MSDQPNLRLIGAQLARILDEQRDQRLRLDGLEARFGALEGRFSGFERRLDAIEQRQSGILAILTRIAARLEQ